MNSQVHAYLFRVYLVIPVLPHLRIHWSALSLFLSVYSAGLFYSIYTIIFLHFLDFFISYHPRCIFPLNKFRVRHLSSPNIISLCLEKSSIFNICSSWFLDDTITFKWFISTLLNLTLNRHESRVVHSKTVVSLVNHGIFVSDHSKSRSMTSKFK